MLPTFMLLPILQDLIYTKVTRLVYWLFYPVYLVCSVLFLIILDILKNEMTTDLCNDQYNF